ncbi:MAG TPA: DNA methyltransferase [Thermomicrobiales bacterium]|nr:DNA methyltransferase [Thermomicrobiales bacterium]
MDRVYYADNLDVLRSLPSASIPLIYIDPPFNTGRERVRTALRTVRAADGDRTGFQGERYATTVLGTERYADAFDDYAAFLEPRLREAHRILAPDGTLYFHGDYREIHYCKVQLDGIFGRASFLNEIIWAYDYGGRTSKRWPPKHDTILVYVKDPHNYVFNADDVDREPYMAPGLVGPEKAARGKLPSDCYSEDTDVFTDRGWLPFKDLALTDRVASVSPQGELLYARPSKIHAHRYRGPMCSFHTKAIDLLVTPNHRLYLRPKHGDEYCFVEAQAVIHEGQARGSSFYYALRNQLSWQGEEPTEGSFQVPPCDYQRAYAAKPLPTFDLGDWCEFLGLYIAEGNATSYADRHEVGITQLKSENLGHIASLLRRMGLTFHYDGRTFIICNKQLTLYLRSFGKAHEKFVPRDLLRLPRPYLERLYEGLMRGDGHRRGDEEIYSTTSRRLADDVQELLLKRGYNANIILTRHAEEKFPNWKPLYCVSRRISRESTIFPSKHASMVDYDGMVYCCTVEPYHTLLVRRNGKPVVCGNCWWHTIVSPTGKEKTGYPTQKPLGVLRRIVRASSRPGDVVLDFFAGSGTTGAAARELGRRFLLVDNNEAALRVMARRFAAYPDLEFVGFDPATATTGVDQNPLPLPALGEGGGAARERGGGG